jgi:hypothetical protein
MFFCASFFASGSAATLAKASLNILTAQADLSGAAALKTKVEKTTSSLSI